MMTKKISEIRQVCHEVKTVLSGKQRVKCLALIGMILVGSLFEMLGVSVVVPLVQVILSPDTLLQNPYLEGFLLKLHIGTAR